MLLTSKPYAIASAARQVSDFKAHVQRTSSASMTSLDLQIGSFIPIQSSTLHAIELFEALKGLAAIAASLGLLSLAHHDVRAMAYALMGHFHVNPDAHFPQMRLNDSSALQNADLR